MMADKPPNRFLIKFAWSNVIVVLLVAIIATWIRSLTPVSIIGWIALFVLSSVMVLSAYQVRRALLGIGFLTVAALLFVTSLLRTERWAVDQDLLKNMTFGAIATAIWFFAWDARTNKISPVVGHIAGALLMLWMVSVAVFSVVVGQSFFGNPKFLISVAAVWPLYKLVDKRWEVPLALIAISTMIIIIVKVAPFAKVKPK